MSRVKWAIPLGTKMTEVIVTEYCPDETRVRMKKWRMKTAGEGCDAVHR